MSKETPENKSPSSWIWNKSVLIASAIMNAISLINIGRDLKLTFIRWAEFLVVFFDYIEKIVDIVSYPFSILFRFISLEIPSITKNIYSIVFLTVFIYRRANKLSRIESGEKISNTLHFILSLLMGMVFGLVLSSLEWFLSFILKSHYIPSIIVFILILVVILTLAIPSNTKVNDRFERLQHFFLEYIKLIFLFIFLISLLNYFAITF